MAQPADIETKKSSNRKRRELSREKIIAATLRILAQEDESALTMRRVAAECGVSAMALYHHVDNKEQLGDLAVDHIFLAVAERMRAWNGDWREGIEALMDEVRAGLITTPGAGTIFVRRAVVGPGTALLTEVALRLLTEGGITGQALAEAMDGQTMLLIGSVANELTRPARVRDGLAAQFPADQIPHLSSAIESYSNRDPAARFHLSMNWLLDGALARSAP